MLTALRRVLIPTFATLLLFASSAAAECAWVLWREYTKPIKMWEVVEAHRTVKECTRDLTELVRSMQSGGGWSTTVENDLRAASFFKEDQRGMLMMGSLSCLP